MARRRMSLIALPLLAGLCGPRGAAQQRVSPLHEASANFDLEDVTPFLRRVVALVDSGFAAGDAKVLAARIAKQAVGSGHEYKYSVVAGGVRGPLLIRVLMDDADAPELYFFTNRALAERIDAAMKKYFEEVGK
jgi:hypothetical protein